MRSHRALRTHAAARRRRSAILRSVALTLSTRCTTSCEFETTQQPMGGWANLPGMSSSSHTSISTQT